VLVAVLPVWVALAGGAALKAGGGEGVCMRQVLSFNAVFNVTFNVTFKGTFNVTFDGR
jgi:hypothetical protein